MLFILPRSSVVYSAPVYCCLFCPSLVLLISFIQGTSHSIRVRSKEQVVLFALDPRIKSFYSRWTQGTSHSIRVGSKEQVILFALDPRNKSFYSRWIQRTSHSIRVVSKEPNYAKESSEGRSPVGERRTSCGVLRQQRESREEDESRLTVTRRRAVLWAMPYFADTGEHTATLYTTNKMYSSTHKPRNNI